MALAFLAVRFVRKQLGPEGEITGSGQKLNSLRYLDEFAFGFNRRKSRHVGKIFHRLVEQLVLRKALTYRDITAKPRPSN